MINLEERFNLTNKLGHPTNARIVVYRFLKREQAEYFTELLVERDIDFEVQVDEDDSRKPIYFGVSRSVERAVDKLNFTALGRNREKFIASTPLRWAVIVFTIVIITLAITGAILSS